MRRILPLKEQKPNRKLDFYVTFGSESFRILPNPSESCSIFPRILRFATMVFGLLLCRKVRIALIAGSQSDQTGEHSRCTATLLNFTGTYLFYTKTGKLPDTCIF